MRKKLLLLICLLLNIGLFSKTIVVCENCQFKTINQAVKFSEKHDTLLVKKGIYKENNIIIKKPLTLLGENNPVIDGEFKKYIIVIKSDSVRLLGFTLKNVGQSYTKDFAAIYISKSKYYTIENNILEKVFFGMLIEKSHYGIVRNNKVSSEAKTQATSGNGIHLWHCSNALIEKNEVFLLRDGVYFEFVKESKIFNNYSHNNLRYGLHFMFSNHDKYEGNTFEKNGAGVAVMFSKFIIMKKNKFKENWGTASYGLLLKEIYDAEIENNTFSQNTIGIFTEGSTRMNYRNNIFLRNGWGVKISGACYNNIFRYNNFMHNAFDLSYDNTKLNDNTFNENYWSSYTGYDLDKNGIGDVPYRPIKLFSYIVNKSPETIVLLRSLFIDIINFSEKVSPVFTPNNLVDQLPLMQPKK